MANRLPRRYRSTGSPARLSSSTTDPGTEGQQLAHAGLDPPETDLDLERGVQEYVDLGGCAAGGVAAGLGKLSLLNVDGRGCFCVGRLGCFSIGHVLGSFPGRWPGGGDGPDRLLSRLQ